MRAILLAAGLGTRLRPLTNTVPKCLLPINGKPLLQIWIERLAAAGVSPLLVNTHYLAPQVETFVGTRPFREHVRLVHETHLLGTAGTLVANAAFFGNEDGLLIHADNYCETNLNEFIQAHRSRPHECLMTMMTFHTDDPSSCGILELDARGVVTGFHEKVAQPPGNLANSAIYILSRELIASIGRAVPSPADFSKDVIPPLINKIYTYHTSEIFADIGSVESYDRVRQLVRQ